MEEQSTSSFLRIECPKCKTRYRIDRSKIPPQGAKVRCKKCNAKLLLIKKPKSEQLPKIAHTDTGKCPKCGFNQKHGEFCYKCGARIRQAGPKEDFYSQTGIKKSIPMALLDLLVDYNKLYFYLGLIKPVFEIDHEIYPRSWGKHQFQIPPGKYTFKVYGRFLGLHLFERSFIIQMNKDDYVQMQYKFFSFNDIQFIPIIQEPNASWRFLLQKETVTEQQSFHLHPYIILFLLLTAYPVGLYLLIKTKHFSNSNKWIIGTIALIAYIYLIFGNRLASL